MPAVEPDFSALFTALENHEHIALAVSGGADSTALMIATAKWAKAHDRLGDIFVLSVDHQLRRQAKQEAESVCKRAQSLGMHGHVLTWHHDGVSSKVQEKARMARYELIGAFCREYNIPVVLTAHHQDDQVETMLMRLSHGSGLDGLIGMRDDVDMFGARVVRPFMKIERHALSCFLERCKEPWVQDPSNENPNFERVRIRNVIKDFKAGGISLDGLARSGERLARAQIILEDETDRLMRNSVEVFATGYVKIQRSLFEKARAETAIRLLKRLVEWSNGGNMPVQLSEIERAYAVLVSSKETRMTLAGCIVSPRKSSILIGREFGRMDARIVQSEGVWDGRFVVASGIFVQPFGNLIGASECRRPDDLPHFVACCLPAIKKTDGEYYVPHLNNIEKSDENCPISLIKLPKGYVNHA